MPLTAFVFVLLYAASAAAQTSNDDAVLARRAHCSGSPLAAHALASYLRGRAALAGGDVDAALADAGAAVREVPSFPDAHLLLANALHAAGRSDEALRELDLLRDMPATAGCSPIPLDRVLFNAGNIAADTGNNDAARRSYEEALREAESHATGPDLRRAGPDIRNNLGQLLLRMAGERGNDRALLRLAEEQLDAAANTPSYRTRHYAYLGLARVAVAGGRVGEALEAAAKALTLEPQYEDALDFVAGLAHSDNADTAARAGILFIGEARLALPSRYARNTYGSRLNETGVKIADRTSPLAYQFLATLDVFNGNYTAAEAKLADTSQPGAGLWRLALSTRIAVERGDVAAAEASGAALQKAIATHRPTTPWDAATLSAAAASYSAVDPPHAEGLVARFVTPSGAFSWQPAIFGVLTDAGGNPLPGAIIVAQLPGGASRTATTDSGGRYEIAVPEQGTYEVQATLAGMATTHATAIVGDEGGALLLALNVAPVSVPSPKGVPPPKEEVTVTSRKVEESFRFIQFTQLTPPPGGASVSGASNPLNTYVIDGADVSDSFFARPSAIPIGSVQAMNTSACMPGELRITTRSGTNEPEETAQLEGEPSGARSAPQAVAMPPALHEDRDDEALHATAGGPLVRDRLWFFTTGDLRRDRGRPANAAIAGEARDRQAQLFAKLNARTARTEESLFVNRLEGRRSGIVDDVAGAAYGSPSSTTRDGRRTSTVASLLAEEFLAERLILEGHATWHEERTSLRPASLAGEAPQVRSVALGFFTGGGTGLIDDGRRDRQNSVGGAVTYLLSRRGDSIRLSARQDRESDRLRDRLSGGYMIDLPTQSVHYWALGDDTKPASLIDETFDNSSTTATAVFSGQYGRLSVETGLRWDRQRVDFPAGAPATSPPPIVSPPIPAGRFPVLAEPSLTTTLLQPHLCVRFDPGNDGQWLVGTSFRRIADPLTRDERVAFGTSRRYVSIAQGERAYGGLAQIDPNLRMGAEDELTTSLEHVFANDGHVQILASRRSLRDEIEDFFCDPLRHRCLGNPGRGLMAATPRAHSATDRIQAGAGRRSPDSGWQLDYWWQRSHGNVESADLASTRVPGSDPYSRPAFDTPALVPPDGPPAREHRHTLYGTATRTWKLSDSKHKLIATATAFWMSGEPRTLFLYSDLYGRFVSYAAPRGAAGHSPAAYDADAQLVYERPVAHGSLQLGAALRNVLNRQTATIDDQRSGAFAVPMERLEPRTGRLFARFTF